MSAMFDVAIIGYGPAGATLANQLGQAGLSVVVLERDADIYPLPRAIHFDGEIMRVYQNLGLRGEVERISRPGLKGMQFVNAAGETLLVRGGTTPHGPQGCASNYYFHQPELEQVLREGVKRFDQVQVRLRHEVTQLDDHGDHVTLAVKDLEHDAEQVLQARYVVGCDGARSLVRRTIGTAMTDLGLHQPWLVFDVLLKPDAPTLPDCTVQHCDPVRPMTYCNVTGNRRRWEIMLMPGDDPEQLVQPETLWRLVSPWVTPQQADIERAVIYTFHSLIAETWRKGRLLLAGDAAHQTPPFLGQGMCAAVRDVANLAWKLEAVLRGRADEALLDTYGSERLPHVHAFIDLAVRLGAVIQVTDPQQARERDARLLGAPETFEFPAPGLGAGLVEGPRPAGQIFPQPLLADGRLLDEHLGARFALIGRPEVLDSAEAATQAAWAAGERTGHLAVLRVSSGPLADWLAQQQVQAVVVRPDRYVLGVAQEAAQLADLIALLPLGHTRAELTPA